MTQQQLGVGIPSAMAKLLLWISGTGDGVGLGQFVVVAGGLARKTEPWSAVGLVASDAREVLEASGDSESVRWRTSSRGFRLRRQQ